VAVWSHRREHVERCGDGSANGSIIPRYHVEQLMKRFGLGNSRFSINVALEFPPDCTESPLS
jgi:hypothetical protein